MATKIYCEMMVRSLCHDWIADPEQFGRSRAELTFVAFRDWLRQHGHAKIDDMMRVLGCSAEANRWLVDEMQRDVVWP